MSTTILEPPIRVFKLTTEGREKFGDISQRYSRINTIYDIQKSCTELLDVSEKYKRKENTSGRMHDTVNCVVGALREPIADIQEKRGISKNHQYSFVDLLTGLFQHSYSAVLSILTMVMGLMPLMEGMLILVRFILDKILEINNTDSAFEKMYKTVVFVAELFIMCVMVALIVTLILMPVLQLIRYCVARVWSIILSG